MAPERLHYIRSLETLVPLHAHTDAITINELGRVSVQTQLPAPVDDHGIPRPEILVSQLLAQMTTENYVWTGTFDEHHLATPKADFTIVRTADEGDIGSAFRGLACLKIMLPRQMHNFSHALFELPKRPSLEVMRAAVSEVGAARQLNDTITEFIPDPRVEVPERVQAACVSALHHKIESMQEPSVGLLPSREELYGMHIQELQKTVTALLRVRRFSKKHLIHPAIRKKNSPQGIAA